MNDGHAIQHGQVLRVLRRLPVIISSNAAGKSCVERLTHNELHNSDERNFMKWLALKAPKNHLL